MNSLVSRKIIERSAILELNRPDRGNALSIEMVRELRGSLQDVFTDTKFDTVVIAGAGRNFCTGFDLDGIENQSDGDILKRFVEIELLLSEIWHAPIRTVALAKGKTWGAGADIFAACDFRMAQSAATFRFPGAGFGIVLGTRRLCVRVGETTTRRWISANEEIRTAEAWSTGLVTILTDLDDLESWAASNLPKLRVQRATLNDLYRASRADLRDVDLANLVRSAATPGLRDRIITYASSGRRTSAHSGQGAPDGR